MPFSDPKTLFKIVYAPLAGCSDYPFRKMAARYKPSLMFCEMVKMEALIRKVAGTYGMLDYSEEMRPIGAQLCGSQPGLAKEAGKIIEDLGFDVVDLNCGCPVDKITKDGSGSALLKNPALIGEILANIKAAVSIPVTLKIRVGWDENSINAVDILKIAEQAGATAIFVHGRTRQQGYKGPANWSHIKACKEAARKIFVIGNGDLFHPQAALNMWDQTGCDGVLISRGTMGQPWMAEEIRALLRQEVLPQRGPTEYKQALLDHFMISTQHKSEKGALIDMRKVCCWYLRGSSHVRDLRARASRAVSLEEVRELIESYHPLEQNGAFDEMNLENDEICC